MKKYILISSLCLLVLCGCSKSEPVTSEPVQDEQIYGTDYESTWGDLIEANGGEPVWDTLSDDQRELVHYPKLDADKVYWTPNGYSYHSVDWCYTLERSKSILNGTLDEAKEKGLDPCSKCVEK